MSAVIIKSQYRKQVAWLFGAALLAGTVLSLLVGNYYADQARTGLEQRSKQVLALHKEAIFGLLDKFRLMTVLVARRPDTRLKFIRWANYNDAQSKLDLQNFAGRLAAMSGANRVRLALPDGKVLAQSTLSDVSGVYLDTALRDTALQDRLGRATNFSHISPNTYSFATSVRDGDKIIGIVNIDVDLQVLENAWALSGDLIFITDEQGRFIVGNQLAGLLSQDKYRSYGPTTQEISATIAGEERMFLARGEHFNHIGWTLNVFIDAARIVTARNSAMIITALIVAVLAAISFILLQRRLAYLTRLDAERNAASILENKVAKRTAQLQGSNQKLQREFDERVAAEAALKQAQDSLIQSAKLAAIGQMSTALAHEYNQPLAAIRSYADNARAFLQQQKTGNADDNLMRIAKMTERMAQLSKTLKTFARTPRTKLTPLALTPLLEEAVLLVGPSAKKHNIALEFEQPDAPVQVRAGHVRLSQVVVNLLSNAIDAVGDLPGARVRLSAGVKGQSVQILVEDSGPGVPKENRSKIFDAFFTSKEVGDGLGLGLSIAYNIVHDFGGEISVTDSELGGAAFLVELPRATKPETTRMEK